jgi:hypothetical protein
VTQETLRKATLIARLLALALLGCSSLFSLYINWQRQIERQEFRKWRDQQWSRQR